MEDWGIEIPLRQYFSSKNSYKDSNNKHSGTYKWPPYCAFSLKINFMGF